MRLTLTALVLALAIGCSHAAPTTTPLLSPPAVVLLETSLGVLQAAAISLAPVDGISPADTTRVVNAVTIALQTIEAGKLGWLSALDVALNKIPAALTPASAAVLGPYFDAIELVIQDLYSSGVL
jgi:hypothetical protein